MLVFACVSSVSTVTRAWMAVEKYKEAVFLFHFASAFSSLADS